MPQLPGRVDHTIAVLTSIVAEMDGDVVFQVEQVDAQVGEFLSSDRIWATIGPVVCWLFGVDKLWSISAREPPRRRFRDRIDAKLTAARRAPSQLGDSPE